MTTRSSTTAPVGRRAAPEGAPSVRAGRSPGRIRRRTLGLPAILLALVLAVAASLAFGANPLGLGEVWSGLTRRDGSEASAVVWDLRIPRTVCGVATGAAFGVAGALIQALTRNPLADPGILGVNAGAGFAVTLGVGLAGGLAISGYLWFAFLGAAGATVLVYLIGSVGGRGTADPVTLVLAGVALAAVLSGVAEFLTLIDPLTFERLRSWGLGSISRTTLDDTLTVLPFLVAGLVLAGALGSALNSISLGDDLAASLGTQVGRTRLLGVVAVTLLAGGGTALTGGIAFVGLMVPHIVRWFTGPDQRWILLYSALAAPALVLFADVLGRVVGRPGEIEVGLVVAILGGPVLIGLVRRARVSGL